jgi:hypothetical protein
MVVAHTGDVLCLTGSLNSLINLFLEVKLMTCPRVVMVIVFSGLIGQICAFMVG